MRDGDNRDCQLGAISGSSEQATDAESANYGDTASNRCGDKHPQTKHYFGVN